MNVAKLRMTLASYDLPLYIKLPDGSFAPQHFHITEVGHVKKRFIDCGGTRRETEHCALQVWVANDKDHRLSSKKLHKIMELSQDLVDGSLPVMVEYGEGTISQYLVGDVDVGCGGIYLLLGEKKTCCLAPDKCGVSCCESGCC